MIVTGGAAGSRWALGVVLFAVLAAGCTQTTDLVPATPTVTDSVTETVTQGTLAGTVTQGTTRPADWPAGLDLPAGATLVRSTVDRTGMSVLFDAPQDLGGLRAFFDATLAGLGYTAETDNGYAEVLSRSWVDGSSVVSVTATTVDGRSSGVLIVRSAE